MKKIVKKPSILRNRTFIIGCGRLGSSMANKCSLEGKYIIVMDKDPDSFDRLSDNFGGLAVVGDVTDLALLEANHIENSKEIIITTGDDNINIFIAHIARKRYNIPDIYVRLDNPENEVLLKGMEIKAIYPFELSFDKFNVLRGVRK